jgi:ParB family transcriptional regulator, chromosome partitioning protein
MLAKKRALGRGLDSLLGSDPVESPTAADSAAGDLNLAVATIRPNPFQPRKHFDPDKLEELAASIKKNGILQPLIVRRMGSDFEIVAGERRWRAAQRAGLTAVPAIIRGYTDQEMLAWALIENLQREDLNPIEEAKAFQQLIEQFEFTQEQIAERIGKSRVAVTNTLRLLKLPESIAHWIQEGTISAGHARALLSIENESLQLALAREIMNGGLSVREAEKRVRNLIKAPNPNPRAEQPQIEINTQDLQDKLRLHFGLEVRIFPKSNSEGRIEVQYSSLDEFQHFFEQLGISLE